MAVNPARSSRSVVVATSANSHGSRQPLKWSRNGGSVMSTAARAEHAAEVAGTAALRHQPAARHERPADAGEQPIVIEDPVKRRGAQHRVEDVDERQPTSRRRGRRAGGSEACRCRPGAARGARVPRRRLAQHRLRPIDGDDQPVPHRREQLGRQAPGAAAEIEDALVRFGREPFEYVPPPSELRIREAVIAFSVPIGHRDQR